MKRIAFAEFIDDIDAANRITAFFGMETDKSKDDVGEKIGDDRMGSFFSNLGATLVIGTFVFALIVVAIILLSKYGRKCKLSDKNNKRVEAIKTKIFFNALIRYLLMNALKLYMSAFVILGQSWEDKASVTFAFFMLMFLFSVPILASRTLYKENDNLTKDKSLKKYGNLYVGKDVDPEKQHRIWIFPLLFFYRRFIFACVSVFAFSDPAI